MIQVILVIQLIVTVSMITLILLQRSEGGGLGIGGGGGLGGFASPQSTANALTKATGVLAAIFIVANMTLAVMSEGTGTSASIAEHLDKASTVSTVAPEEAKEAKEPAAADKKAPSVPVAE